MVQPRTFRSPLDVKARKRAAGKQRGVQVAPAKDVPTVSPIQGAARGVRTEDGVAPVTTPPTAVAPTITTQPSSPIRPLTAADAAQNLDLLQRQQQLAIQAGNTEEEARLTRLIQAGVRHAIGGDFPGAPPRGTTPLGENVIVQPTGGGAPVLGLLPPGGARSEFFTAQPGGTLQQQLTFEQQRLGEIPGIVRTEAERRAREAGTFTETPQFQRGFETDVGALTRGATLSANQRIAALRRRLGIV